MSRSRGTSTSKVSNIEKRSTTTPPSLKRTRKRDTDLRLSTDAARDAICGAR
jgi:hypothetical protein